MTVETKKLVIKKIALSVFLLLIIGGVSSYMVPGCASRFRVNKLSTQSVGIERYYEVLGQPVRIVKEEERIAKDPVLNSIEEGMKGEGGVFYIWAKEGIPYYWVIVEEDSITKRVTNVIVR